MKTILLLIALNWFMTLAREGHLKCLRGAQRPPPAGFPVFAIFVLAEQLRGNPAVSGPGLISAVSFAFRETQPAGA